MKNKPRKTNVRWKIGTLMWLAITINYLDRANLSTASTDIMREFSLNSAQMGIVMSAFFWSYLVFQIPSGWLADRVGHRISMALAVGWWSIATALTTLAARLFQLNRSQIITRCWRSWRNAIKQRYRNALVPR